MAKVTLRKNNRQKRKLRIRKKVAGTADRPRLSVFRSNKYSYGQLVDDIKGRTVVGLTLEEIKSAHEKKSKNEASFEIGKLLAEKALGKKIKKAVLDRSGYKFHGRIKKLAEGAREGGLQL
jgi:large subunit ribosomal protein L18